MCVCVCMFVSVPVCLYIYIHIRRGYIFTYQERIEFQLVKKYNRSFALPYKIPIIYHDLRGYDSHFIMQEIVKFKQEIVIPNIYIYIYIQQIA